MFPVPVSLVVPMTRKVRPRTTRNVHTIIVRPLVGGITAMFVSYLWATLAGERCLRIRRRAGLGEQGLVLRI